MAFIVDSVKNRKSKNGWKMSIRQEHQRLGTAETRIENTVNFDVVGGAQR